MRTTDHEVKIETGDANRDPITGEPGAHPVGVGVGAAAAGAAVGAAAGAVGGPIGTAVGTVVGAVAGGLAGKGIAEKIDPTTETTYWKSTYTSRPYFKKDDQFEDFEPAYRYGWESRLRHVDKEWPDVETDLSRDWETARGKSSLTWDRARPATRDAWDRVTSGTKKS